jgi:Sulfatase-modifying factor enzyme 1
VYLGNNYESGYFVSILALGTCLPLRGQSPDVFGFVRFQSRVAAAGGWSCGLLERAASIWPWSLERRYPTSASNWKRSGSPTAPANWICVPKIATAESHLCRATTTTRASSTGNVGFNWSGVARLKFAPSHESRFCRFFPRLGSGPLGRSHSRSRRPQSGRYCGAIEFTSGLRRLDILASRITPEASRELPTDFPTERPSQYWQCHWFRAPVCGVDTSPSYAEIHVYQENRDGIARYRLPTEAEWKKAARGTDHATHRLFSLATRCGGNRSVRPQGGS